MNSNTLVTRISSFLPSRRVLLGAALFAMMAVGATGPAAAQSPPSSVPLPPHDLTQAPFTCDGKVATIVGTPGPDTILGTPGDDVIVTLGGNDTVYSVGGDDVICAGSGNDYVRGGDGNDKIFGGDDNDYLFGEDGNDWLIGGDGLDLLDGGPHVFGDRCDGGAPAVGDTAAACESMINVP